MLVLVYEESSDKQDIIITLRMIQNFAQRYYIFSRYAKKSPAALTRGRGGNIMHGVYFLSTLLL